MYREHIIYFVINYFFREPLIIAYVNIILRNIAHNRRLVSELYRERIPLVLTFI